MWYRSKESPIPVVMGCRTIAMRASVPNSRTGPTAKDRWGWFSIEPRTTGRALTVFRASKSNTIVRQSQPERPTPLASGRIRTRCRGLIASLVMLFLLLRLCSTHNPKNERGSIGRWPSVRRILSPNCSGRSKAITDCVSFAKFFEETWQLPTQGPCALSEFERILDCPFSIVSR